MIAGNLMIIIIKLKKDRQGTNLQFLKKPRFKALLQITDGLPSLVGTGLEQAGHEESTLRRGAAVTGTTSRSQRAD